MQAQIFFMAGEKLDRLELCLDNKKDEVVELPLRLVKLNHIWDYYKGGQEVIASTTLQIDPGNDQWVSWTIALEGVAEGVYRLEASPADGLKWRQTTSLQPGCFCQRHMSPTRLRSRPTGLAFRLFPGQPVYGPEQVRQKFNHLT